MPEKARWHTISAAAHTPEIGTVIDDAMRAIEADNKKLKNVLPKNYASPDLDKRVLGDVVDLFTNMNMEDTEESKDLLGRTYEYCIAQFAAYEGVKGGEFYTPASIVKTIVAVLRPFSKDTGKNVLIATNCVRNENLYPTYEKVRYFTDDVYNTWFRAHPLPGDVIPHFKKNF